MLINVFRLQRVIDVSIETGLVRDYSELENLRCIFINQRSLNKDEKGKGQFETFKFVSFSNVPKTDL